MLFESTSTNDGNQANALGFTIGLFENAYLNIVGILL